MILTSLKIYEQTNKQTRFSLIFSLPHLFQCLWSASPQLYIGLYQPEMRRNDPPTAGPIFFEDIRVLFSPLCTNMRPHTLPGFTLDTQLNVTPPRRIPRLAWKGCEAERKTAGATGSIISQNKVI